MYWREERNDEFWVIFERPSGNLRRLQDELGNLGRAIIAHRFTDHTQPAIGVEQHVIDAVHTKIVLASQVWQDQGANSWDADLPPVGVPGELNGYPAIPGIYIGQVGLMA